MKENFANEVLYYTFPNFEKYPFIRHAFSSREGGVSTGYFSSMNLGINTPDERTNIVQNYRIFCDTLKLDSNKVVLAQLTHEANIKNVAAKDEGCGLIHPFTYEHIDGLLTNEPGPILVSTFADCVPIFFLDPVKKVIGMAHSGWRGTVLLIAKRMVERMQSDYGCKPTDILAGIGPSIGMCCFEVTKEVYLEFAKIPFLSGDWFYDKENGKYDIDMWRVIYETLTDSGLLEENITISGLCTKCNSALFFSHRATQGKRGAMAGIISIVE